MGRPKGSRNTAAHTNAAGSRLPRRHKNKAGKETGSFFLTIGSKEVNLWTQDAGKALERAKLARKGERNFPKDDDAGAVTSVAATVVGTEAAKPADVVESPVPAASGSQVQASSPPAPTYPTHTGPAALPAIGAPPTPGTPPTREEVKPDGYIPPAPGWAAAVAGAAGASGAPDPEPEPMDEEFLEGLIEQAAALAVELQLMLQAWIVKRRLELNAAPVPESGDGSKGRTIGVKIWKKEIRKMMPDDLPLPGWVVAPLMIAAYTIPVQLANATPINNDRPAPPPAASPQDEVVT